MTAPVVGFVGLTHLGVVSAVAVAARGFQVVAFDGDADVVDAVGAGRLPVFEPGLDELFDTVRERLEVTADATALARCTVVYVAVDVPTGDDGTSDLAPIRAAAATAASSASASATIVVLSQVPPGFTRPLHDADPRFVYQVETLVFGRAVERATQPERYIVGLADPAAGLPPELGAVLDAFGCPILPMRFESAELTKIAINLFLAASVTTTNTVAGICEEIGADWREIAPALRLDARIGPHAYLGAGLGISGGNIERDLATTMAVAGTVGAAVPVIRATVADSEHRKRWALRRLAPVLARPGSSVAILGIAYKQDTASTKGSPGLALAEAIGAVDVRWHDPVVERGPAGAVHAATPGEACAGADAVVITTPWDEYRSLDVRAIAESMRGELVIDPFGVLDDDACRAAGLQHDVIGVGR